MFVSSDDGAQWQPLKLNLPNCSIRDIDVRHGDLVVGTHGRSFWALDDLSPLRQFDAITPSAGLALLAPRPAVRLHAAPFQGTPEPKDEPMAENPPRGAVLDYFVKSETREPLVIEIKDASGGLVRRYASDTSRHHRRTFNASRFRPTGCPCRSLRHRRPACTVSPGIFTTLWLRSSPDPPAIPTGTPVLGPRPEPTRSACLAGESP